MTLEVLQQALEKVAEALPAYIDGVAARDYLAVIHKALAQQEHPEQMARLGWQYVECPACGSEGARAFPKPEGQPVAWLKAIETPGGFGKFVEAKPNEKGAKPVYLSPPAQPAQTLPFGVGGGLVAIKTLLSRDPCVHANTAIQMIDAILKEHPAAQRTWQGLTDAHVEMIAAWLETQMIETPTTGPHLANALRYVGAKLKEKNT